MVQIPMVGSNVESKYIPNRGEGDRGSNTGNHVRNSLFLQGVSIAGYASPVLATIGMSVRRSVCSSHGGIE